MLLAKSSTSRFNHDTDCAGYSKPAPGPLILKMEYCLIDGEEKVSTGERDKREERFEEGGFRRVGPLAAGW
jgi:hypothetical protein